MPVKKPGMRASINAHCKSCIYDKAEPGTWRQQVEACTVTSCALYPHRPLPANSKNGPNRGQNEAQTTKTDAVGGARD